MITIVPYKEDYKEHIKSLNYEWLEKYFAVEPNDVIQLSNPQAEIIDKGGFILICLNNSDSLSLSNQKYFYGLLNRFNCKGNN
jgi:hypothetical protein